MAINQDVCYKRLQFSGNNSYWRLIMIYLDNAATTKPSRRAMKVAKEAMENEWFNPSSLYDDAVKVSQKIKKSKQIISDLIGVKPSQITFTSGATEGNNTILNQDWDWVVTSEIEHDSILNSTPENKTILIPVDEKGYLMTSVLEERIHNLKGKILVSIIIVNNEIGTIQKLGKIADIVHSRPNCYLHIDATQAMGKVLLNYNLADYITASAHKFHGIKGTGFIVHKRPITAFIKGGHQENEIRAGTENTPGILSMTEALQESYDNLEDNFKKVTELRDMMLNNLTSLADVRVNSDIDNPYILNVSFKNINAESLLLMLSLKKIYVSSGSACNSKNTNVSRILQKIHVPEDYIYGTIRISFSPDNLYREIEDASKEIISCVKSIRHSRGVDKLE